MGEEADGVRIFGTVRAGGAADDIVGEHSSNVDTGVLVCLGEEVGAVEILLFTCYGYEDERTSWVLGSHDASQFHRHSDTGGIVVGAWGVRGVVIGI